MKSFLEFLEKHSKFIKKVIIFFIAYLCISVFNNEAVTLFFTELFGEYMTTAIHALIPTFLLTSEV